MTSKGLIDHWILARATIAAEHSDHKDRSESEDVQGGADSQVLERG